MTLEHLHSNKNLFNGVCNISTMTFDIVKTYDRLISMDFADYTNTGMITNQFYQNMIKDTHQCGFFTCSINSLYPYKFKHISEYRIKDVPVLVSSLKDLEIAFLPSSYQRAYYMTGIGPDVMNSFTYKIYDIDARPITVERILEYYKHIQRTHYLYTENLNDFFKYVEMFKYDKNMI